jgi:hypothetical protein
MARLYASAPARRITRTGKNPKVSQSRNSSHIQQRAIRRPRRRSPPLFEVVILTLSEAEGEEPPYLTRHRIPPEFRTNFVSSPKTT